MKQRHASLFTKKSTFIGTARCSMAPLKTVRKNKWHRASRSPGGRYGLYSRKPGVDGCEAAVDGCHVVSQSLCNLLPPSPPSITGASVESAAGKQKKKNTRGKELQLQPQFFSFGLVATGAATNGYFCWRLIYWLFF